MLRNLVLLLVACTALTGCVFFSGTDTTRETFSKAAVKKIEPGKTTKDDILKWFGPPVAIARKGEEDKIISVENVRADTFLELFSAKRTLTEHDIVYYYRSVKSSKSGVLVVFAAGENTRSSTAKLWVLIDDRNGIVEDFFTSEKP